MPFFNRIINYSRSFAKKYIDLFIQNIWYPQTTLVHLPNGYYELDSAMSSDGKQISIALNGGVSSSYRYNVNISNDYGDTFQPIAMGGGYQCGLTTSIAMSSNGSNQLLTVYTQFVSRPFYSTNSGVTWNCSEGVAAQGDMRGAVMSSNGSIAGIVAFGELYISTNTGACFTQRCAGAGVGFSSIAMSSNGVRQVGTTNCGIYASTNTGFTWTSLPNSNKSNGFNDRIASSSDGQILTSVGISGIQVSTNYGQSWNIVCANTFVRSISMSLDGSKQTALAALGYWTGNYNVENLLASSDYGSTWTIKCLPLGGGYYPDRPEQIRSADMSADGKKQIAVGYSIYRSFI